MKNKCIKFKDREMNTTRRPRVSAVQSGVTKCKGNISSTCVGVPFYVYHICCWGYGHINFEVLVRTRQCNTKILPGRCSDYKVRTEAEAVQVWGVCVDTDQITSCPGYWCHGRYVLCVKFRGVSSFHNMDEIYFYNLQTSTEVAFKEYC